MERNYSIKQFALALVSTLSRSRRVLVACHAHPDTDALSSLCAFAHILIAYKIPYVLVAEKYNGTYLSSLPGISQVERNTKILRPHDFDAIVFVDAHSFRRTELAHFPQSHTTFAIDHHPLDRGAHTAKHLLVIPEYTSTCSLLFELIESLSIPISNVLANVLLCGVLADCETFKNQATNQHTFVQVAKLLRLGADVNLVDRLAFQSVSVSELRAVGRDLGRVLVNHEYETGILVTEGGKTELASVLKRTRFPNTTVIIRENPKSGQVDVSMRSPVTNVGSLARVLGGGGHDKAAAFRFNGKVVEKDGKWSIV